MHGKYNTKRYLKVKGYPRMRCRKENDRTTWSFDTWPLHLSEMSVPNEMDSGKS